MVVNAGAVLTKRLIGYREPCLGYLRYPTPILAPSDWYKPGHASGSQWINFLAMHVVGS